jgi:HD-like signal output (HDOD) protein
MSNDHARYEIQKLKQLPNLSPNIQRLLDCCGNPEVTQTELTEVLSESPTIAARLLGLSNSAFFGQQGRVHSLMHAISVLGLVTVRSVAVSLSLSGMFRIKRCPHFSAEGYWSSSIMAALMANEINADIQKDLRPAADSVYMAGLLHNIGLLAMVQLYPDEMEQAFVAYEANPDRNLGEYVKDRLDATQYQAGVWVGSKWHLPEDMLLVMEYHYDRNYRGKHWPLVLLEGLCASWASQIVNGREELSPETESLAALGLPQERVDALWKQMRNKLKSIQEISALFAQD